MQFAHAAVIGAANGIGAEIASYLREHGAKSLLLIDKSHRFGGSDPTNFTRGEHLLRADVSCKEQVAHILRNVTPGFFDLVVLSAGVRTDDEVSMQQVNFHGVQNSIEVVAPLMKKGGLLVLVSSDYFTFAPENPYAKTKRAGALAALSAAQNYADDFRVLILLPGPAHTQLFAHDKPPQVLDQIEASEGIFSTAAFTKMLFDEVIPQSLIRPSGSIVAMYKRKGFTWRTGL